MKMLRVKNWAEFQHYKHRSPPWIKLHRELLNDFAFQSLNDAARSHLMLIWILAAGTDGVVPASAKFIATRIGASGNVDIEAIIAAGFLVPEGEGDEQPSHKGNGSQPINHDTGEVVQMIPIVGGVDFEVRQSFVAEMEKLYPAVDIRQTLNEIRGYFLGKPQKRKTPRGIRGCITSWMGREQDKHGGT